MSIKNNKKNIVEKVIRAISSVVGDSPVALHQPSFNGNEWAYLKRCIDSTVVSSVGEFVEQFEQSLANFTGSNYAIAVVNGTAALHVALILAGVKAGDEVLIPSLTFIATANAVAYCGATPHFVDSEMSTFGIDASKLREYLTSHTEQRSGICVNIRTGKVIRALVPMHTFGHPGDLDGLLGVARDFNIAIVEDAAESLGSFYQNKHTGTFGLVGTLSFNGNKTITTGGGGAILTDNQEIARHAKHITTTAKVPHAWEYRHDEIGFNYRMPNLNAALGCAQLEQLPFLLNSKRKLYEKYKKVFSSINGITLVSEPVGCKSNYWLQALLIDKDDEELRDSILKQTNEAGFMTRPVWILMHKLVMFRDCPRMDLACAESLANRLINIPSSSSLGL